MKKLCLITITVTLLLSSCVNKPSEIEDCQELIEMYNADQKLRASESDEPYEPSDKKGRLRVFELLVEGKIRTNNDKMNAAIILQHTGLVMCDEKIKSINPENYYLAYLLAKSSYENGNKDAAYFTAATYDRYLLYTKGYQKYGTQKIYSTTTDSEREKYKIPSLKVLTEQYEIMQ